MSSNLSLKDGARFAAYCTLISYVPDTETLLKSPKHYRVTQYAQTRLSLNEGYIQAAKQPSKGYFDLAWPMRQLGAGTTLLIDYTIDRPLITIGLIAEKLIRGDFGSTLLIAEKNLENLKKQNAKYEQDLQDLAPTIDLTMRIIKATEQATGDIALKNLEIREKIELEQEQIAEMGESLRAIRLEEAINALEKISAAAKTILTNRFFVEDLSTNAERLERAEQELEELTLSLQKSKTLLNQKTSYLSQLMQEAEQLNLEKEQTLQTIQLQTKILQKKIQNQLTPPHPKAFYDSFSKLIS